MHIIIVGCGKVGRTLAEQLQEEETDLTLIDMCSPIRCQWVYPTSDRCPF